MNKLLCQLLAIGLLAGGVCLPSKAQAQVSNMCSYKPVTTPLTGTECFPLNQNGVTKTVTVQQLTGSGVRGPNSSTIGDAATWSNALGTALADAGGPPVVRVATNAALQALASTATSTVLRTGYYSATDGGTGLYLASNSACSLNAGNGDGGSQVKSSDSKCWLLVQQSAYSPKQWGAADGTATNSIKGTISTSSASLTLSAAGDFANKQPIAIFGAGPSYGGSSATGLTVSSAGATGAATYFYTVASIDQNLGIGPALAGVSTTNSALLGTPLARDGVTLAPAFSLNGQIAGTTLTVNTTTGTMQRGQKIWGVNADVSYSTRITDFISGTGGTGTYRVANFKGTTQTVGAEVMYASTPGVYNQINWTAPVSHPLAYVVYEGSTLATMTCAAVVTGTGQYGTVWRDYGPNNRQLCPSWIPSAPLVTAQNGMFQAKILSGGGTTNLTLNASATSSITSGVFIHDSTAALQGVTSLGLPTVSDCAQYNTLGTITLVDSGIAGGGQGCTIIKGYGGFNIVTQSSVDTHLQSLDIDASQEVAGFAISISASRVRDRDMNILGPYNQVEVTSSLQPVLDNVRGTSSPGGGAGSALRGDYGMYAHTPSIGGIVQNMLLYNFTVPSTTTAISYLQDGSVNGTRSWDLDLQGGPHEFIVQNTVGAVGSDFGMFYNMGTNFAWDDNMALLDRANGYVFERLYCQGAVGNGSSCLYIGSGVGPISFTGGSQIFGNDYNGIEEHGNTLNLEPTTMVYGNSQVGKGIASKIYIAADALGGQMVALAAGDRFSGTSITPLERYGILIASGFNGGVTNGFPQVVTTTAAGGTDNPVCDFTGLYGQVTINGLVSPGTCSNTTVANDVDTTYSAGQFVPAVLSQVAYIYRSGMTTGRTDTTPTAPAIEALIPGVQVNDKFTFQMINLDNNTITLAGGTRVTISGTVNTVGFTTHNFLCRVTNIGAGTEAVTCTGA